MEPHWTKSYVQYLTQGTQWKGDLPKAKKLMACCSQFIILTEGKLHCIFHNNIIKQCIPGKYVRSYIKTLYILVNQHYSINATQKLI